jgi:hypothetical protein
MLSQLLSLPRRHHAAQDTSRMTTPSLSPRLRTAHRIPITLMQTTRLCKGARSLRRKQLLALGVAVRQREFEVLADKLLDVRASDLLWVGDLDDFQNLSTSLAISSSPPPQPQI